MSDLGTLGGTTSYANGINDNGQVVGFSSLAGDNVHHAFLYSNGSMSDLGTLGGTINSMANGINNNGQVVGRSSSADFLTSRAFLYSNGSMTDLNTLLTPESGWTVTDASAINDAGQIVGAGTINDQTHAYLMTPVPVPAAVWLFSSGLLGLLGIAKRRKQ